MNALARALALGAVMTLGPTPASATPEESAGPGPSPGPSASTSGVRRPRFLLSVGSNFGLEQEETLAHAVDDANRVAALLGEIGGMARARTEILADPSPAALMQAVGALASRAADAEAIFVYVSAHGDDEALHLGGERLPIADLHRAIASLPAPLKVIIIDACRSAGTIGKGVAPAPSFTVALPATAFHHEGMVTVLASGKGETA